MPTNGPSIGVATVPHLVGNLALQPETMKDALDFANYMAKDDQLPAHLRGKPSNCLRIVIQAVQWKMNPYAVADKTFFLNNRICYEGQLVAAVVNQYAPIKERLQISWEGEKEELTCTVSGHFEGEDQPRVMKRLLKKVVGNSKEWAKTPDQMLAYRTIRDWARLYCPDIILGVYTPEELEQGEMKDITPGSKAEAFEAAVEDVQGPLETAELPKEESGTAREEEEAQAFVAIPDELRRPAAFLGQTETKDDLGVFLMWARDQIEKAPSIAYLAEWDHLNEPVIEKVRTMSAVTHSRLRVLIDQRRKALTDNDLLANLGA